MNRIINVCVDTDGILFNLFKYQMEKGMKYFDKTADDVNTFSYDIEQMFNCSSDERLKFWVRHIYDYCMHSEVVDEIVDLIKKWRAQGINVYNPTARVYVDRQDILGVIFRAMLEKRYKIEGIEFDDIDYCSEKYSPRDKSISCHKHQADFLIEDKIDNSLEVIKNGRTQVLLLDYPYNQNCDVPNVTRIFNVKDMDKIIQEHISSLDETIGNKKYVVNGRLKRVRDDQLSQLSSAELMEYSKQLKQYYSDLPYDSKEIRRQEINYKLAYYGIIPAFKVIFRPRVFNKENLLFQNGVIYVSNHMTYYDQFPIISAIGNKPIHFMTASELLEMKRGILYSNTGSVPVDRNSMISQFRALELCKKIITHNGNVFIFPEGSRNPEKKEWKEGAIILAKETGAPIVPLAITDSYRPFGDQLMVRVGEPILLSPDCDVAKENLGLKNKIESLVNQNQQLIIQKTVEKNERGISFRKM